MKGELDMDAKQQVVDRLEGRKAEEFFNITSMSKDDLRKEFSDDKEALNKIDELGEGEMEYLASKMDDSYCECCFWISLRSNFESRFLDKR